MLIIVSEDHQARPGRFFACAAQHLGRGCAEGRQVQKPDLCQEDRGGREQVCKDAEDEEGEGQFGVPDAGATAASIAGATGETQGKGAGGGSDEPACGASSGEAACGACDVRGEAGETCGCSVDKCVANSRLAALEEVSELMMRLSGSCCLSLSPQTRLHTHTAHTRHTDTLNTYDLGNARARQRGETNAAATQRYPPSPSKYFPSCCGHTWPRAHRD